MKNHFFNFFCTSFFLLSPLLLYGQADYCSWEGLSNAPNHRVESQAASVNGKLYIFSGFGFEIKILSSTTMYDPLTDTWTEKAPILTPVTHMGAVVVGNEVWMAGGFEGDNPGKAIKAVQIYNTVTDSWRYGPSLPAERASSAMALLGRKLHVFGGLKPDRQTDVSEHYVLDLDKQAAGWQNAAPLPEARNHLSAATVGGKIYAIGGQKGHDVSIENTDFLHVYDPLTNQWERKANLTFERSHFEPATFVLDGEIYIVGGRTEFQFFNQITKYSPETNTWTELCDLPRKLLAPSARVINDQLYITHGGASNVRNPLNTVQRRPIERNPSTAMGFLRSKIDLSLASANQTDIEEVVWVKSGVPGYKLSLSGNPSWIKATAYSKKASHEGDQVIISVDTKGLAPGNYSTVLKAEASGYVTAELPISITVSSDEIAEAIYLNTGEGETITVNGISYVSDSSLPSVYDSEHTYTNTALSNILYQTERGSSQNEGSLTYNIPVANGKYTVKTHHAELYFGYKVENGTGKRVFDISLEGKLQKENVDLFQEGVGVGQSLEAKIFTFEEVEVTDGTLTLSMQASVNRPTISALEIIPINATNNEFLLEAEQASLGSHWQIGEDSEASGGKFITIKPGLNSYEQVPSGNANHVTFNFEVSKAGAYQVLARVKASNSSNDSFWFKVNDGEWINWGEGVQTYTFAWKEIVASPFAFRQGTNNITFAYREDGAELDKIHIKSAGFSDPVSSTDIWLETECASLLGNNWEVGEDEEASGGQFVTIKSGKNSYSKAPSGNAGQISFNFNISETGAYQIFARVKASNSSNDSFWFKVNDGEWMNWWEGVQTYSFAWKEIVASPFAFRQGINTITFAYREDGAELDKLFLTLNGQQPEGIGETDVNCNGVNDVARIAKNGKNISSSAESSAFIGTGAEASDFIIFPNPTADEVKVQLGQSYEGGGFLYLYNAQGRLLQQIKVTEQSTSLNTRLLPAGMYFVQYGDGKNRLSRKLQVSK